LTLLAFSYILCSWSFTEKRGHTFLLFLQCSYGKTVRTRNGAGMRLCIVAAVRMGICMRAKISTRFVKSLTPREKPYEIYDEDLTGFMVRVQPIQTARSFV
jgi:hypothetical protein